MRQKMKLLTAFSLTLVMLLGSIIPTSANEKINFALNKPATASFSYPSMGPEKAFDDNLETRWSSEPNGSDQWLRVDLEQEQTFDEFVIANEASNAQKIKKFKIEGSNDDKNYEIIYDSVINNEGFDLVNTITLNQSVTYRYVKITIESLIDGAYPSISLREFEILGNKEINEVDKSELQKVYDEYKGFVPQYMDNSSYMQKYTAAVTNAETILADEMATEIEVERAINNLSNRYWFVSMQDRVYHYSPTRNNFDYSLYETESIIPLFALYKKGNNYSANATSVENTEAFKNICLSFDKVTQELVLDTGKTGVSVGLNGEESSVYAKKKQGSFTITETIITNEDGKKSLQLNISFENTGINPISGLEADKLSLSDLRNMKFRLHYYSYDQKQAATVFITDYMTDDNQPNKVYEGSINVDEILDTVYRKEGDYPGLYYVEMYSGSNKLYSLGYFRTSNYAVDSSQLETYIEKIESIDKNLYTEESYKHITNALEEAKTILQNYLTTQDEIDNALKELISVYESLEYKDADYSKVDEAINEANALNKELYKDFTSVEEAIEAVERGLDITKQSEVDAMAEAIHESIASLEYKDADYSKVDEAINEANALNK
ncbi:MAG: discoidin domain-containing protein, partial [Massilimicrobiota timonensis]